MLAVFEQATFLARAMLITCMPTCGGRTLGRRQLVAQHTHHLYAIKTLQPIPSCPEQPAAAPLALPCIMAGTPRRAGDAMAASSAPASLIFAVVGQEGLDLSCNFMLEVRNMKMA